METGCNSNQRAGGQGSQPGPKDQTEFHYLEDFFFFLQKITNLLENPGGKVHKGVTTVAHL